MGRCVLRCALFTPPHQRQHQQQKHKNSNCRPSCWFREKTSKFPSLFSECERGHTSSTHTSFSCTAHTRNSVLLSHQRLLCLHPLSQRRLLQCTQHTRKP